MQCLIGNLCLIRSECLAILQTLPKPNFTTKELFTVTIKFDCFLLRINPFLLKYPKDDHLLRKSVARMIKNVSSTSH